MDTIEETGRSLLEHSQAQSLLAGAQVTAGQVRGSRRRLESFLERYVPLFYRKEQGHNARIVVEGLLSGLERKTAEPIAREHGVPRKPIQFFVGSGKWDDEAVMAELRRHVVETLGDPHGVVVVVVKSAEKGARRRAQKGATYTINSNVRYDAVNRILHAHP